MTPRIFLSVALVGLALTGCKTFTPGQLVTPARVKAVASVAAYYGAKAAIAKGHQAQVTSALAALETLSAAPEPDLAAILAAIQAGGITFGATAEGEFILGAGAILFSDFWQATGQTALSKPLVQAFLDGVIRGATLASEATDMNPAGDATGEILKRAAKATR